MDFPYRAWLSKDWPHVMRRVVSIKVQVSGDADFRWSFEWRKVIAEVSAGWNKREEFLPDRDKLLLVLMIAR